MTLKKCFLFNTIAVFLIISFMFSQNKIMKTYGGEVKLKKVTPFHEVFENSGKFRNRSIVIEGTVTAVCKTKGCWMEVTDGKEKIRVKFENYGYFVPWDSKGKHVKVQGKVLKEKVKAETYKQWLKESGEPFDTIDRIQGDRKVLTFIATGVLMEGGSEISPEQQKAIQNNENK
jgi:hypothetical protein